MLQRRRTPAQRSAAAVAHARLQHCVGSGADRHVAVLAVAGSTGSTVPRPNSARRSSRPARKTVRLPHSTLGSTRSHPKHWVRRPCTPPTSVSNPPGTAQKVGDNNRGVHTLYRRPRPIPDDGSTRCMTKSCAGTSCGVRGSGCAAMTARGASTGSLRMPLRSTG